MKGINMKKIILAGAFITLALAGCAEPDPEVPVDDPSFDQPEEPKSLFVGEVVEFPDGTTVRCVTKADQDIGGFLTCDW